MYRFQSPRLPKLLTLLLLVLACHSASLLANTSIIWRGDFETGDLSQWSYLLNPQGLSIQNGCVYEGLWAGKVSITGDDEFLWHGATHLNRTEFEYKPQATTADTDTFFGWSFLLPSAFSSAKHEFGYWESDQSWQQKLRFNLHATDLSFQESSQQAPFWHSKNRIKAGQWHDITVHIHWSEDPKKGFVKTFFDGKFVSSNTFQTLANPKHTMFTHLGILRQQEASIETLYIDNARHGSTLASVLSGFDADNIKTCTTP